MYETIDSIVKGWLLSKGYPLHRYFRALKYAADCIQQLSFTTLKNVQTTLLDVDSFGQSQLPFGFVDYIKIGLPNGQHVQPMSKNESFNRLDNIDSDGNQQLRGFGVNGDYSVVGLGVGYGYNFGYYAGWYGAVNMSQVTTNIYENQGYKVIKELGKIQFSEHLIGKKVYLEYITYMPCADLMTKIDPRAKFAIYAYIDWQEKENNRSSGLGERQQAQIHYGEQRRNLRSLLSDLTLEDIKNVFRESYYPQPKG